MKCRICDNSAGNKEHTVREMMYGTGEAFVYLECAACGCLQLVQVPERMDRYYPQDYLSFGATDAGNPLKRMLKRKRNEYAVFHTGLLGRMVHGFYRDAFFSIDIVKDLNLRRDWRILDVGCGNGRSLLYPLRELGCRNLHGVDAFIAANVDDGPVHIRKGFIHELPEAEPFDLIVLSHTLEHVPDQRQTLEKAGRLLARDGVCLVRIPVKSDYIWQRYGVHWIQIDAPRHLFIHTLQSMEILTRQAGLRIRDTVFDSTAMQFWGSEQYLQGIAYTAPNSYVVAPRKSIFSAGEMRRFQEMARDLNLRQQGDQAAFHLIRGSVE